jgi:dienelactone hydrolase
VKLRNTTISIPAEGVWLDGLLSHQPLVHGLALILLPGAGDRASEREQRVAQVLHDAGLATLTIDLLTRHEETRDPDARFNVPQLANRVLAVAEWIGHQPPLVPLAIGLVASGTASGAAVRAAWKAPERFAAIVCRGGRPDLAGAAPLEALRLPIRIVVGSLDPDQHIIMQAYERIRGPRDTQLVAGAGALFAEPGALDQFARLASDWLRQSLPEPRPVEAASPERSPDDPGFTGPL